MNSNRVIPMTVCIDLLNPAETSQVQACLNIYSPFIDQSAVSFESSVPTITDFQERAVEVCKNYPWLLALKENEILGYAYAARHRGREGYQWVAEVSVYLSDLARGQGLASLLYQQLFELLRSQNIYQVYAGITLPNPASQKFHLREGFEDIGTYKKIGYKFGCWHDVYWCAKELRSLEKKPAAFIPHPKL